MAQIHRRIGILAKILVTIYFASSSTSLARDQIWLCPEFGPCQFQMIVGPCLGTLIFEYTRSLQVRGSDQVSPWEFDRPRPCAITLKVGARRDRWTYEVYHCNELLNLFYQAGKQYNAQRFDSTESDLPLACEADVQKGTLLLTFPSTFVKDGLWRPLERQLLTIPGLGQCQINVSNRAIVCGQIKDSELDWLRQVLSKVKWRVLRRLPHPQLESKTLKLAPGDRMKPGF